LIILHFSQIFLTEALTFISVFSLSRISSVQRSAPNQDYNRYELIRLAHSAQIASSFQNRLA
jgi:hypothetical protein